MADKKKRDDKETHWVDGLEGYSRQIWLAGLGAYTRMGKEGTKLFEALIRDGEEAEKSATGKADKADKAEGKGGRSKKDPLESARAKVDKARSRLNDKLGGLEELFDKRLAGAAERLGLVRQEELQALETRIAELTRAVEQLNTAPAAAAKPVRARAKAAASAASVAPTSLADSVAEAASHAAAATPTAAKASPRRRVTAPKAATRGTSAPAPATDAAPGSPAEQ